MNTQQNKQALAAAFERLTTGDGEGLIDLMSEDIAWTIAGVATPWARTWSGKRAVREGLLGPLFAQFGGAYTAVASSFTADENRVVVEFQGAVMTKGGRRYDNRYCYVCRFDDEGRLTELVEYADTALMNAVLEFPAAGAALGAKPRG